MVWNGNLRAWAALLGVSTSTVSYHLNGQGLPVGPGLGSVLPMPVWRLEMDWLRLGEGLLELLASFHPEGTGPCDGEVDTDTSDADEYYSFYGIGAGDISLLFSDLLAQELAFERSVFEGGPLCRCGFQLWSCLRAGRTP